jgi:hypothetical protein
MSKFPAGYREAQVGYDNQLPDEYYGPEFDALAEYPVIDLKRFDSTDLETLCP